jgi:type IX secretion system PorP/SprF family membrane protein
LVANDVVSDVNLSSSKIALSGAYQINKNDHLIRAGLQTGLSFRQSNFGQQTFPDQWNYSLGIFDQNLSNSELSLSPSYLFLDVNLGVSWTKIYNKWKLNAGLAAFHLNRPKNGFVDGGSDLRLPVRKTINVRADYLFSDRITLTPNMLLTMTAKTQNLLLGLMGKYDITKDLYVGLAVSYRGEAVVSDALIPTFMLGYKRLQLGFSNDYNISSLSDKTSKKSSYELSVIYTTPSATPSRIAIPCQRI